MKNKKGFTLIELLAVMVILGIIIAIAVPTYRSYMSKSKDKAFKNAENAMKTTASDALAHCITNPTGEAKEYCKSHRPPDNQYEYDVAIGDELVKFNYIDPIADPYHSGKYCDMSKSYVYVSNKTNIDDEDNFDLVYKVCLVCGNRKSEDCRDDILNKEETTYDTFCKVTYDEAGLTIYDNKWTDQDLYLNFSSEGNYKYGINQYKYKVGSKSWKKIRAKDNIASAHLTETIGDVEIKSEAYDGFNQKAEGICRGSDGSRIKIDKTKINSVTLTAKQTDGVALTSGSWSLTDVVLTATMDPRTIPSGYHYTWYRNGSIVNKTTEGTYKVTERGTYKVEVTNGVGKQVVRSEEFVVKIDKNKPTCTLVSSGARNGEWYIGNVTTIFSSTGDLENDGIVGSGIVSQTIDKPTTSEDGASVTITGTVIDGVGRKGTCKSIVKHDAKRPVVTPKSNPVYINIGAGKNITDYFTITTGVSGGTTICKVGATTVTNINQLPRGVNNVTCTTTSGSGISGSGTMTFRHQYTATASCTNGGTLVSGNQCRYTNNASVCGTTCHYGCDSCYNSCKTGSPNECVGGYERGSCKRYATSYSCGNPCGGGTMSGSCNKPGQSVVCYENCTSLGCQGASVKACSCTTIRGACLEYNQVWNSCKSTTNTCQGGYEQCNCSNCKTTTANSCTKTAAPYLTYYCPNGGTLNGTICRY